MTLSQEIIIDNYKNPKNFGKPSWKPTHVKHLKNLSCGDAIKMYLLVDDGEIKDVMFEGEGCSICVASGSILTQKIKGESINEVLKIDLDSFISEMGLKLNSTRQKCVDISLEAMKQALTDESSVQS